MPARLKTRADFKAAAGGVRAHAHVPAPAAAPGASPPGGALPATRSGQSRPKKPGSAKRRAPPKDQLFTLQAIRSADTHGDARVGFTVTKKVGNAVVRNRIRRRLRAIVSDRADVFQRGTDYVVVARRPALEAPYAVLCQSLDRAAAVVHERLGAQTADPTDTGRACPHAGH